MKHFWDAMEFFNAHSVNHNFEETFTVVDNQGNRHCIKTVRQLLWLAWKTTRKGTGDE